MIWVVLFILIVIISFYLAWRSMRGYQEAPDELSDANTSFAPFYVSDSKTFNLNSLAKLHAFSESSGYILSLERLFKGKDSALIIYGPETMPETFPELKLVELEDYLQNPTDSKTSVFNEKKVSLNQSYSWTIEPKNNPKKSLIIKPGFLKSLELENEQRFFWQSVIAPIKGTNIFQTTIRAMVVDNNPVKKIELAKKMDLEIENYTGLAKKNSPSSNAQVFDSFVKRAITPKEVASFMVSAEETFKLLGETRA